MTFCTAINCMDGRVQLPVNKYLRNLLRVEYVDTITEPGPVKILAQQRKSSLAKSILRRVDLSVSRHASDSVALVAHHDCAGNPATEAIQRRQLHAATGFLSARYPELTILALWVDSECTVHEVAVIAPESDLNALPT